MRTPNTDINPAYRRLGRRIAQKRAALDLSLRDAARRADVSHMAIVYAEAGESTFDTLAKIARALGISLDDIMEALSQAFPKAA